MGTNVFAETPRLTLTELAHREGVAVSTVWRWSTRGVRGVRLESFSLGCRRFTTEAAFARFSSRCTDAAQGDAVRPESSRQRETRLQRADAEADRLLGA